MSNAKSKLPTVEILATLDDEPAVNFFPWQKDVRTQAAGQCKHITATGLLSVLLTDQQWAEYPSNNSIDAQGNPVLAPRFVPPAPITINDGMTSVELYVAKASNDQLSEWLAGEEALKNAITKSMGATVRNIVEHPEHGFSLLNIMQIMAVVRGRFGRMRKNTKLDMKEKMTARLASINLFDSHISNLKQLFFISSTGGQPIVASDQVEYLRKSLSGNHLMETIISQYDFLHHDDSTHTFDAIVDYITDHLPNVQVAAKSASDATANIMASEVYLTLQAENKSLKAQQSQGTRNQKKRKNAKGDKGTGKKGKGKHKKNKQGNRSTGTPSEEKEAKYCHGHGTQPSHTSAECKMMAADKTTFTAAMRNAKDADHPPGGCTRINGQEQ